jgi:lysyl-tRNA synthetase class I
VIGQQFHQYQQNKERLNSDWSTIPPISTKQGKIKVIGQQFHQYQQNKERLNSDWSTIPPISTKQGKIKQ